MVVAARTSSTPFETKRVSRPSSRRPRLLPTYLARLKFPLLCGALFLALGTLPSNALVEPGIEGWEEVVQEIETSLPGPAGAMLAETADEFGKLGCELAAAPLRELMIELESRRGLQFKYFTPWHSKNKTRFRRYIRTELERVYTPEMIDKEESLLKALGLVPIEFQVVPFTEELLTDAVAGIYDTTTDQFFLVDSESGSSFTEGLRNRAVSTLTGDTRSITIIHELDHALGGQHFPLLAKIDALVDTASHDELMAVKALVEGDASFVMFDHQGGSAPELLGGDLYLSGLDAASDLMLRFPLPLPGMGKFNQAPLYYRRSLLFPYYVGAEFVSSVRHVEQDWTEVNRAYDDPPFSTAQIYEPSRYLYLPNTPSNPDFSKLPARFGAWTRIDDQTGGEFLLRVLLEQYGVKNFREAAGGWMGDRLRIYRNTATGALGFYWVIRWLDVWEAQEFYTSLGSRLPFEVEREDTVTIISLAFTKPELRSLRAAVSGLR